MTIALDDRALRLNSTGRGGARKGHARDALPRLIKTNESKTLFAKVVLPHLGEAYSLARWLTGNRDDAEDVVQDACLRAFRAIEGFEHGDARVWTLQIVRNAAYHWMRKNRQATVVMGRDLESVEEMQALPYEPDAETPETALIAKIDISCLKEKIEKLPDPIKVILVLRDLQGCSYREIAEICGLPIGTVMSRLARARNCLAQDPCFSAQ
jgi:RNA polymerase sigma factor (sigma-70 family)